MIDLIHDIFKIADRYGLKAANIDATDVTLMAGIEISPGYLHTGLSKSEEGQPEYGFDFWKK